MPLHLIIKPNTNTKLFIWKITETYEELYSQVVLNMKNRARLEGMKSEMHQRGFLSVRKLLQEAGYNDLELYYDEFGKPHLKGEKFISITHSHHFSAIIISDKQVGIDIELQREKITKIADKFINKEIQFLDKNKLEEYIQKLTVIWGAKEAIFKIQNEKGISFKDHITVVSFELQSSRTVAHLSFGKLKKIFDIHYQSIEDFGLVYAFESELILK